MTRKMFFCYERNQVDRHWQPVVYYDAMPPKSNQGVESERSEVWDVPDNCCDQAGGKKNPHLEPNFGKLQKRFPKP